MTISDHIIQMIEEKKYSGAVIRKTSNLYSDLAFDSLSFITLLVEIEEAYSITLDISEMEDCLWVGRLVALVEKKVKEVTGK